MHSLPLLQQLLKNNLVWGPSPDGLLCSFVLLLCMTIKLCPPASANTTATAVSSGPFQSSGLSWPNTMPTSFTFPSDRYPRGTVMHACAGCSPGISMLQEMCCTAVSVWNSMPPAGMLAPAPSSTCQWNRTMAQ